MERRTVGRQGFAISEEAVEYGPETAKGLDPKIFENLLKDSEAVGGAWESDPGFNGAVAWTMFDSSGSDDSTVTIVLQRDNISLTPSQSLVRIVSREPNGGANRTYLGIVTKGPFAEPDGLRADSPLVITTTIQEMVFTPQYHGRCQVELMGEEIDGQIMPPRFRPLPKSPVWVLDELETAKYMKVEGDLLLGRAHGHDNIEVKIPADKKSVLPRHTAILGTTGGGKSTTVSRLVQQAQANDFATIIFDVEGEYAYLSEPTNDPTMLTALEKRGQSPAGVVKPYLLHLVGRETVNPDYQYKRAFSLDFARLSPYFLCEILDLSEAQQLRFMRAYDWARLLLRDLKIYPANPDEENDAIALDEFETGTPRLKLAHLIDVVAYYLHVLQQSKGKEKDKDKPVGTETYLVCPEFHNNRDRLPQRIIKDGTDSEVSWLAVMARLKRLARLKIFDRDKDETGARLQPLDYGKMLEPGRVYIVDLSDTDSPELNNLVITEMLRGLQEAQDVAYQRHEKHGTPLTKVMIVIEEAHEFLSSERISKMPLLFQQVAKIAKRGRKRWLSLVFVTQLPQHLPRELLGLVNNYILHKINDATTVNMLQKVIAGIDDGLWKRLPALAPGQAIASFTHMARPLLVAVDPTPARLRMID